MADYCCTGKPPTLSVYSWLPRCARSARLASSSIGPSVDLQTAYPDPWSCTQCPDSQAHSPAIPSHPTPLQEQHAVHRHQCCATGAWYEQTPDSPRLADHPSGFNLYVLTCRGAVSAGGNSCSVVRSALSAQRTPSDNCTHQIPSRPSFLVLGRAALPHDRVWPLRIDVT